MEIKRSTALDNGPGCEIQGSTDLSLATGLFSTGWQRALLRPPTIRLSSLSFEGSTPNVLKVAIGRSRIRTIGFTFPEGKRALGGEALPSAFSKNGRSARKTGALFQRRSLGKTRIRPSQDIIKLEDRLYFVLQPSLEMQFVSGELKFPFQPFDYQLQGIAFLYPRVAAVLADEMGLGKTMQAITAVRLLLVLGEVRRVLLICPKPLVTNWCREFEMWAPEVPLAVVSGDQTRRRWQWGLPDVPVKIANYELLIRDQELLTDPEQEFDLVILDEAQRIKNRASNTSQVARSIRRRRSWALTGTPIENSTDDLVGIFEFLSPGYLRPEMPARRLGRAVQDYVLRRTKDKVLTELPPKLYRDADLDLLGQQRESYELAEKEGVVRLSEMGAEVTIQHVFELVLRLKQICNFDPATGESCKLERLMADLEEVAASGQKAIVFSQWVKTLQHLNDPLACFQPLQYHGKISHRRRQQILEQFQQDPDVHVLLMSYGAGSVGLNLQFCRYVFLFDRWWNPAVEDQAINRAHRIGVNGTVTITRFLTLNTIEERINQVLIEKRELFETIFSHATSTRHPLFSQKDLFGLFDLHMSKGSLNEAA